MAGLELSDGFAWISMCLARYCLAVDDKDIDAVVGVLGGASVTLRNSGTISDPAAIRALYGAAFATSGATAHLLATPSLRINSDRSLHFESTYQRFRLTPALVLEAVGRYRGTFAPFRDGYRLLSLEVIGLR